MVRIISRSQLREAVYKGARLQLPSLAIPLSLRGILRQISSSLGMRRQHQGIVEMDGCEWLLYSAHHEYYVRVLQHLDH